MTILLDFREEIVYGQHMGFLIKVISFSVMGPSFSFPHRVCSSATAVAVVLMAAPIMKLHHNLG